LRADPDDLGLTFLLHPAGLEWLPDNVRIALAEIYSDSFPLKIKIAILWGMLHAIHFQTGPHQRRFPQMKNRP
jgi:hypothetical protein